MSTNPDNSVRLFIGLRVPDEIGERLLRNVRATLPDREEDGNAVRIYEPDDLHLTLCFLGHQPPEVAKRIRRFLVDETRGLAAPELQLTGVGAFPDADRPRALWAGVSEEVGTEGRLAALHNRALTVGLGAGWRRPEADRRRGFRPHVTVARLSGKEAGGGAAEDFMHLRPRGSWIVTDVALYESRPDRPEARYEVLAEAPLAVRPG